MIEEDDIERVRAAVDLVDLVSEFTQVKRVGRRWQALCPFHTEKSPSFSINQEAGLYHCFGCGVSGDVIAFVREHEHLGFVAAVERLAARASVTLRYTDDQETEHRRQRRGLHDAVARAVDWYHQRLLTAPDAEAARTYLAGRGVTADQVERYRLGWAPAGWDDLARALALPAEVVTAAGLGFVNKGGRVTDSFRARVMFPIFDTEDRPVGFGGRILPGAEGPKYKNSAESKLYAKSRVLYGLNWARADVVHTGTVVVCEGYTDVLGFAAAGVATAVATCGTSLTDDHVKLLTSYARRIVLAFDADTAGQGAAARVYEWERRHNVDVAVARLPPGVDPADLARSDPAALQAAVDDAQPFLGFRVARIFDAADLTSPEGRARAAGAVLDAVREHPDPLVRDQYVMNVATRTGIDPDQLRRRLDGNRRRSEPPPSDEPPPDDERPQVPVPETEVGALKLLVLRPDPTAGLLNAGLFTDRRARAAYELLAAGDVRHAINAAGDTPVGKLLRRVAVEDHDADPADVVDLLLRTGIARVIADYQRAFAEDFAKDPDNLDLFVEHSTIVRALQLQVSDLHEDRPPEAREAARHALLDWLRPDPEPVPVTGPVASR
jgi:DNA primase